MQRLQQVPTVWWALLFVRLISTKWIVHSQVSFTTFPLQHFNILCLIFYSFRFFYYFYFAAAGPTHIRIGWFGSLSFVCFCYRFVSSFISLTVSDGTNAMTKAFVWLPIGIYLAVISFGNAIYLSLFFFSLSHSSFRSFVQVNSRSKHHRIRLGCQCWNQKCRNHDREPVLRIRPHYPTPCSISFVRTR